MTLEQFAEKVGGKVWRAHGCIRIYFTVDKNVSAYLNYDADLGNEFEIGNEGAVLRVWSNNKSATTRWNVENAKKIKFQIMKKIAAVTGDEICEKWEDVIL